MAQQQNNVNGYQTQDGAARGALTGANPASIKANREYGGLIYSDKDGKYHYSGPVIGGDQGLRGVRISPMEGVARAHAAHGEELQLHNFAAQPGHALEPIHLSFLAQLITLRHEYFPPAEVREMEQGYLTRALEVAKARGAAKAPEMDPQARTIQKRKTR